MCSCAGKGAEGWTYAQCTCEQAPTWDYIRFGDPEKRDVEGVMMSNPLLDNKPNKIWVQGEWGSADDFACNSLLYSIEHKLIVDLSGGLAVRDAAKKKLRIPADNMLDIWQKHKPQLDI